MASPIQVVLDAKSFIQSFDRPPGGGRKDLYQGRNRAFREHRDALVNQVRALTEAPNAFRRSRVTVANVELAHDALAKSNRPTVLLKDLPPMGSAHSGELLVQVTAEDLSRLVDRIAQAPVETRTVERVDLETGEVTIEERAGALRCDVGAIERIALWTPERRLSLSDEQVQRWLEQGRTPLGLIVQLFTYHGDFAQDFSSELNQLETGLQQLGCATAHEVIGTNDHATDYLQLNLASPRGTGDSWRERLGPALALLRESFTVRSIAVPAKLTETAKTPALRLNQRVDIPRPRASVKYPMVGIVDGGIGEPLSGWVKYREQLVSPQHRDEEHGTYIGGLLVVGQMLNGDEVAAEKDGCELADICILPTDNDKTLFARYFSNTTKFMDELDRIVGKLRQERGVRIFNFSLNFDAPSGSVDYGYETRRMDEIAHKYDVVFVISAGNLPDGAHRAEWPEDDVSALQALALSRSDQISSPAESMTNVSVAAVNAPGVPGYLDRVPAAYSRRGPSLFGGVKPDVAHFGGCAVEPGKRSGLLSINSKGALVSESGTSYAVPMVAKILASYPVEIEGDPSREMLIALLVHHARVPKKLQSKAFESLARDLVGFGLPQDARTSLDGAPHSVTIVFEETIPKGQRLEFPFDWPASLTEKGRCRGRGRLTLVSRPVLDSNQGHEVVRTQLDAHVIQLDEHGKKKGGHFYAAHLPKLLRGKSKLKEAELIRHALKWSPVKTYHFKARDGVGVSSRWRLTVESLERTLGEQPMTGTHFVAILTIEDIQEEAPVFDDVRLSFVRQGTRIADIRTAVRTRTRAGSS